MAPLTAGTDRRLPLPVCALSLPVRLKPGLAKAIGVVMKLDFERAVLNRLPVKESHPERYFRQVLFLCDEYQHLRPSAKTTPPATRKGSPYDAELEHEIYRFAGHQPTLSKSHDGPVLKGLLHGATIRP